MLVPAPGVVGDRPRIPDQSRRRLKLVGHDPADLRHALRRIAGAKVRIVREHWATAEHSLVGRNDGLTFNGEMFDGGAVAARRGVVGDGCARQCVPCDEVGGVAPFCEVGSAQEPAVIGANEVRRIGPFRTNSRSYQPRLIIRCARPSASAPSAPGRTRSQTSALLASPTWRGSTTMSFIPRFSAATVAVACVRRV